MITASGEQEKLAAIEASADDFIANPLEQAELRVSTERGFAEIGRERNGVVL